MSSPSIQPRSGVGRTDRPAGPPPGPAPTAEALSRAVGYDQLVLHYHPVVEIGTGQVRGVEALVRWQHPQLGLLGPEEIIPLAEASGLIVELGEWVLRTGAAQATAWSTAGRPLDVAINLSPLQMVAPGFADRVCALLAEVDAAPERIVLEVTESALMDPPHAAESLQRLHAFGIRLALDDFGTGYASYSYLRRFPIDIVKVDRGFVAGLGRHRDDDAIVASVVGLAHSTGKSVVAEGVETAEQLGLLQQLGVQSAQGFLWTRPLPVGSLETWLADVQLCPTALAPAAGPARGRRVQAQCGPEVDRIRELHAAGASLHTIAAALNGEGLRTPSGVRWHVSTVAKTLAERTAHIPV